MKLDTSLEIEYPESDGKPMGETDWHRDWMVRIIELWKRRYAGQRTYVTGDLLVYYQEGDPSRFVVPDAMVVKDCEQRQRRIFKIWEEGRKPNVVLETTSRSSKVDDSVHKPRVYEQLGVGEYFLYDPTGEYLRPALQGYRLTPDGYERIEPDAEGRLHSQELGLWLSLEESELVMVDVVNGGRLQTAEEVAEAEQSAREGAEEVAERERAAREAAEAEVARLRDELRRHGLAD